MNTLAKNCTLKSSLKIILGTSLLFLSLLSAGLLTKELTCLILRDEEASFIEPVVYINGKCVIVNEKITLLSICSSIFVGLVMVTTISGVICSFGLLIWTCVVNFKPVVIAKNPELVEQTTFDIQT
jgi:hypothetical protein